MEPRNVAVFNRWGSNEEGWRSPPPPFPGYRGPAIDKELAWCESEEEAKESPSGLRVVVQIMILVGLVRVRARESRGCLTCSSWQYFFSVPRQR